VQGIEDVDVVFGNPDLHHHAVRRVAEMEAEERTAAGLASGEIAGGSFAFPQTDSAASSMFGSTAAQRRGRTRRTPPDPAVYDRPDHFLPSRPGPAPIAFGHGAHYCLGASMARLETTAALRHILSRRPVLAGTPAWRDTPAIRGPLTVPVRFTS
jgi:hypothetical protein